MRLSAVADVVDSVQDLRNAGMANGRPSVLVIINRQPNANIIETVDRVTALLPSLRASIPSAISLIARDGAHGHHPRLVARRTSAGIAIVLVIPSSSSPAQQLRDLIVVAVPVSSSAAS